MKKFINYILVLLFMGVIATSNVLAEGITLEDVVKQINEDEYYDSLNNENAIATVTSDEKSITYKYEITNKKGKTTTYKTVFKYSDGVLSFEYKGDKTSSKVYTQILLNDIATNGVIFAVGKLNNIDESILWNIEDMSIFNFEDNGLLYQPFTYKSDVDGIGVVTDSIEKFKIDINKLNFGDLEKEEDKEIEEVKEEKSNKGLYIGIGVAVVVIGALAFILYKKKSK